MSFIQRVLHQTTDISVNVNDHVSGTASVTYTSGQYIYVGSDLPFNSLWWDITTPNTVAATTSVDIWFANSWNAAVDVIDQSASGGAPLRQDGRISFSTNYLKGWDPELKSEDVTGLSGTAIYNKYWTRWSWNQSLTSGLTVAYIGQKFSADVDMYAMYPDLNNTSLKEAFEANKSDWNAQSYFAAKEIVRDLQRRQMIRNAAQLMDWDVWRVPSVHKTAELIYRGLGKAYVDNVAAARADYKETMNQGYARIDKNASGNLEPNERRTRQDYVTR